MRILDLHEARRKGFRFTYRDKSTRLKVGDTFIFEGKYLTIRRDHVPILFNCNGQQYESVSARFMHVWNTYICMFIAASHGLEIKEGDGIPGRRRIFVLVKET